EEEEQGGCADDPLTDLAPIPGEQEPAVQLFHLLERGAYGRGGRLLQLAGVSVEAHAARASERDPGGAALPVQRDCRGSDAGSVRAGAREQRVHGNPRCRGIRRGRGQEGEHRSLEHKRRAGQREKADEESGDGPRGEVRPEQHAAKPRLSFRLGGPGGGLRRQSGGHRSENSTGMSRMTRTGRPPRSTEPEKRHCTMAASAAASSPGTERSTFAEPASTRPATSTTTRTRTRPVMPIAFAVEG